MRLTALRQPPKDISMHPKNFKHPKTNPKHPDPLNLQCFCYRGSNISTVGKYMRKGLHAVMYDCAAQVPCKHVHAIPLPEMTTLTAETCSKPPLSTTTSHELFPQVSPPRGTQHSKEAHNTGKPRNGMQPLNGGRANAQPQSPIAWRNLLTTYPIKP